MGENTSLSDAKRRLLHLYLRGQQATPESTTTSIPKRASGTQAPLSYSQEQVWVHAQMEPDRPVYNELITIHRRGPLDIPVLQRTFLELVRRHEAWRTTFEVVEGEPAQIVQPVPREIDLPLADLRGLPLAERKAEALRLAAQDGCIPFDLQRGPLWRAQAVRIGDDQYEIFMVIHQLIMDGVTGFRVLVPEIAAIYEAFSRRESSPLAELPFQYRDFAFWQREHVTGESMAAQWAYWKNQLSGEPAVLQWPNDRPRPPVQTFRGATEPLDVPLSVVDPLKAVAKTEGVTLYMALLAGFASLLHRYTGQEQIVLGTLTAGRTRPELEKLMGYFLNPLVLRLSFSGDPTFRELLQRAREVVLGALGNAEVPFVRLVKDLQAGRDWSRNPFFTIIFSMEPPMAPLSEEWDMTLTDVSSGGAKVDMYLNLYERPDCIAVPVMYNPDLFDRSTVLRMMAHWQTLMRAAASNSNLKVRELPVLPDDEQQLLVQGWNATRRPYPHVCVHQLFEQQAARTPHAPAVTFAGKTLTYAELNRRSNQLAHHLRRLGAGPETRVGICVERSLEMAVGLLGILKAGAAYVPMDPSYPRERLALMQQDAQCTVLVTERCCREIFSSQGQRIVCLDGDKALIGSESTETPRALASPENLAYVIFTSGSTGKPKGVQIEHRSVVNLLLSMQREPGLTAKDTLLAVTSISFDIAALELYLPLITGARLAIAGKDAVLDGMMLRDLLAGSVTVMQATPTTWRLLISAGWTGGNLKVLCGGEALSAELARELTARSVSVWNLYGPTETTIWSAAHRVTPGDAGTQPIGRPIANTEFFVLDPDRQLLPVGIPGELYIGGDGLARSYFRRAGETEARFIGHPFSSVPGARLYRTGDLARYREDGIVEFLGRMDSDQQVKLRGFRIELGEIESTLAAHPSVKAAVATVRGQSHQDRFIASYVVLDQARPCTSTELIDFLKNKLPVYMVPARLMVLDEFPLTPNKKVDRKSLPEPVAQPGERQGVRSGPRNSIELRLLKIWESVLGRKPLDVGDTFFDQGGHSLLAAQLIHRMEQAFGVRLSMATIFKAPTVEKMAELLRRNEKNPAPAEIIPIRPRGSKPPLFCVCVDAGPMYLPLLQHLDPDRPFLGVEMRPEMEAKLSPPYRFGQVAQMLAETIREYQPHGPYYLAGYCISGLVAYETARVLAERGHNVALVSMFLTSNPAPRNDFSKLSQIKALMRRLTISRLWKHLNSANASLGKGPGGVSMQNRVGNFIRDLQLLLWQAGFALRAKFSGGRLRDIREILFAAAKDYRPQRIPAQVAFFRSQAASRIEDPSWGWNQVVAPQDLAIHEIPGNDWEIFWEPNVQHLAAALDLALQGACEAAAKREVAMDSDGEDKYVAGASGGRAAS
jgi:amino acid adenylation domain-containing protein